MFETLFILNRNNTGENDRSIMQPNPLYPWPNHLNYGYTQPKEDSLFKKIKSGM